MTAPARQDWEAARKGCLGATDALALLGLSSFRGPADVVAEVRGLLDRKPIAVELSERGHEWEGPLLAFAAARLAPLRVRPTPNYFVRAAEDLCPGVPFGVSPDSVVEDPSNPSGGVIGTVEAKTAGFASAAKWADGAAPSEYVEQVQLQLAVLCGLGRGRGWIAAAVADGSGIPRLQLVEVLPDAAWQEAALAEVAARWDAWIIRGLTPPPEDSPGGKAIDAEIAARTGRVVPWQASGEDLELMRAAAAAVTRAKEAEEERGALEARLRRRMAETSTRWRGGTAKVSLGATGRLTWS